MKYNNGRYKTVADTEGYKSNCPHFDPCPLCYGCRNYGYYINKCDERCGRNKKFNACDKTKHTPRILSRMIQRQRINLRSSNNED